MIVNINGEKVTLDGKITVEKVSTGEYKLDAPSASVEVTAGGSVQDSTPNKSLSNHLDKDPKWYKTSTNGLTVAQSVDRAFNRILDEIWLEFSGTEVFTGGNDLSSSIEKLIRDGKGRDAAYAIAGSIKNGYKEGKYKGIPLSYIFKGIVDGAIKQPEKVTPPAYASNSIWNYR